MTLVVGEGAPVTVVAHGFGASAAETRALVSGVAGTRVLPVARGHLGAPEPATRPPGATGLAGYADLAADLVAVAAAHGATQALGMSLGAATLLRVLADQPDRFTRVVLLLPALLDRPRARSSALVAALEARDPEALASAVRAELPPELASRTVEAYVRARTAHLLASPGLTALLAGLALEAPVSSPTALSGVTADVLVVGQEGDRVHPAQIAREVAAALPRARLVVFDRPGMVLREREHLRALVRQHLDGSAVTPYG